MARMLVDLTLTLSGPSTWNSVGQCSEALQDPISVKEKMIFISQDCELHPVNSHFDTFSLAGSANGCGPDSMRILVTAPSREIVAISSTVP